MYGNRLLNHTTQREFTPWNLEMKIYWRITFVPIVDLEVHEIEGDDLRHAFSRFDVLDKELN